MKKGFLCGVIDKLCLEHCTVAVVVCCDERLGEGRVLLYLLRC